MTLDFAQHRVAAQLRLRDHLVDLADRVESGDERLGQDRILGQPCLFQVFVDLCDHVGVAPLRRSYL